MEHTYMRAEQIYDVAWQMTKHGIPVDEILQDLDHSGVPLADATLILAQIDHRVRCRGRMMFFIGAIVVTMTVVYVQTCSVNSASAPLSEIILGIAGFLYAMFGIAHWVLGRAVYWRSFRRKKIRTAGWICAECGTENDDKADVCRRCVASRDGIPAQRYDESGSTNMNGDSQPDAATEEQAHGDAEQVPYELVEENATGGNGDTPDALSEEQPATMPLDASAELRTIRWSVAERAWLCPWCESRLDIKSRYPFLGNAYGICAECGGLFLTNKRTWSELCTAEKVCFWLFVLVLYGGIQGLLLGGLLGAMYLDNESVSFLVGAFCGTCAGMTIAYLIGRSLVRKPRLRLPENVAKRAA